MKIKLLCRPTQSGKTFHVIEKIRSIGYDDQTCHIVIVSNNLLETLQMDSRLQEKIPDKSFILSSKSEYKDMYSVIGKFMSSDSRIMICCKNSTRLADIDSMISNKLLAIDFNIWIDEADDLFDSTTPYINSWKKSKKVKGITLITATPKRILEVYPKIDIVKQKQTYDPRQYTSLGEDCKFVTRSYYGTEIKGYVDQVLKEKTVRSDHVYYIPGGRNRKGHVNLMKCLIERHNFYVLTINSDGWRLYSDIEDYEEVEFRGLKPSTAFANMFENNDLSDRPVAITGQICIGRGVTFTSEREQITHAILTHHLEKNEDKAYQAMGRITGNNKKYAKAPIVYCTPELKDIVLKSEQYAMRLGSMKKKAKNAKCIKTPKKVASKKINKNTNSSTKRPGTKRKTVKVVMSKRFN
jgi:hypothetical protein